jgi:hypothetical protein
MKAGTGVRCLQDSIIPQRTCKKDGSLFPSSGHDVIVPFFPDYQEHYSKEPIDYDEWHDGG